MIELRIDTEGLGSSLREALEQSAAGAMAALEAGARVIEAEAKRRCPVDSGHLRRSIRAGVRMEDGDLVAEVGTSVPYAIHVEYGHRARRAVRGSEKKPAGFVPGRYFLKGAFDSQKDRAVRVVCARLAQKGGRA